MVGGYVGHSRWRQTNQEKRPKLKNNSVLISEVKLHISLSYNKAIGMMKKQSFIYLHSRSFTLWYTSMYLQSSTFIYLHLRSSTFICVHLPSSTFIYLQLPPSTFTDLPSCAPLQRHVRA